MREKFRREEGRKGGRGGRSRFGEGVELGWPVDFYMGDERAGGREVEVGVCLFRHVSFFFASFSRTLFGRIGKVFREGRRSRNYLKRSI